MFKHFEPYEAMWVHNRFDIDRLHEAIEGKYKWMRQAGNSFGQLVLMIHEAFQGDPGNRYLYLGENEQMSRRIIMRAFASIMTEEGFTVDNFNRADGRLELRETDMMFMFGHPHEWMEHKYRGYMFSRTFIDLTPETERRYTDQLRILQLRTEEFRYGN